MKNILKTLVLILVNVLFFSCEVDNKEELPSDYILKKQKENQLNDPYLSKDSIPISRYGKFIVIDATTYIKTNSGKQYKFKHFKDRSVSNLDINTSGFEIDEIIKNKTTYQFTPPPTTSNYGGLILNNDVNKHYLIDYNSISSVFTIIKDENANTEMGGSSRPFVGYVQSLKNRIIILKTSDRIDNINNENCKYYTKITLKEIL